MPFPLDMVLGNCYTGFWLWYIYLRSEPRPNRDRETHHTCLWSNYSVSIVLYLHDSWMSLLILIAIRRIWSQAHGSKNICLSNVLNSEDYRTQVKRIIRSESYKFTNLYISQILLPVWSQVFRWKWTPSLQTYDSFDFTHWARSIRPWTS